MRFSSSVLIFALLLAGCGAADTPAASSTMPPAPTAARTSAAEAATIAPAATPEPSLAAEPTAHASPGDRPSDAATGGPCGAQNSNATPTPTPPERNDMGDPTDPCATAEVQPNSGGAAQPCPGGPADDHPPALPQPTQVGAVACPTTQPIGVTVVVAQGSASATPTPLQGQRTIGLPSQQTTVELAVGETFELKLGGGMDWSVQIEDPRIVAREPGNLTPDSQGVYRALAAGSTKLLANGDPTCLKATPPCASPSFLFEITIVVR